MNQPPLSPGAFCANAAGTASRPAEARARASSVFLVFMSDAPVVRTVGPGGMDRCRKCRAHTRPRHGDLDGGFRERFNTHQFSIKRRRSEEHTSELQSPL